MIPPGLGKPLLFILLAAAGALSIRLGIHEFIHKRKTPLFVAKWKTYSPGQTQLSLQLPGEPQPANDKALESNPAVERVERYQITLKDFRVAIWSTTYRAGTIADVRQAALDLASALKDSEEVTDYRRTMNVISHSGRSGMLVNGSFKNVGGQRLFRALLLGEGSKLWQVVVTYSDSDRTASNAALRIINSIKII